MATVRARRRFSILRGFAIGWGVALASVTARAEDAACFGGKAEVVVREQPQATQLHIHGRSLLWSSRDRIRSLALDTGAVTNLGTGDLRAADNRFVVTVSARNQLFLFDRRAHKQRMLADGSRAFELALVSSTVAIHRGYVMFGFTAPEFRREEAGFFRVPIDGGRPAERRAAAPDGATPFVVAGDVVVWLDAEPGALLIHKRPVASTGLPRIERRPFPGGQSVGAPSTDTLRLVDNELFFAAGDSVWSVAIDRPEPVRQRLVGGWWSPQAPESLVVQGPCVYFTDGNVVRRASLDGGAAPETVVGAEQLGDASLASDGRHLYWVSREGRIMRSGPSAAAHVVRPPLVATPAPPQRNQPAAAYDVSLGDDLGCVLLVRDSSDSGQAWRCWRTGSPVMPAGDGAEARGGLSRLASFAMPGLDGLQLVAGSGRFCTKSRDRPRCASGDQVFDSRGAVLRTTEPVTGTHVFVGGTFHCTLGLKGWGCAGDDTYGQRAGDAMVEPARLAAGAGRPRPIWGALGAWHGCVRTDAGKTLCWGRNDLGQLGHVSPDVCGVGDPTAACSRSPRETVLPTNVGVVATDQFTCAVGRGLWCWGGSRDGVFGSAAACPRVLRQAWPTREGPAVAVRATCAGDPVRVAGFSDADAGRPSPAWENETRWGKRERGGPAFRGFSIGPRGICGIAYGRVRCRGGLRSPVLPNGAPELFDQVFVHPGERPRACATAINRKQVICWGEGYSPASEPGRAIEIDFAEGTSAGAPVVDAPAPAQAAAWPKECLVHRACATSPPPLPACSGPAHASEWEKLRTRAASLVGTRITVRGPLAVGPPSSECHRRTCCDSVSARFLVVGASDLDAGGMLLLAGPSCSGDDSRLCCTLPAYGQQVRVEGLLTRWEGGNYVVRSPQICQVPSVSTR